MVKKLLPVLISIFVLYLIWCFIKPSLNYQSIKRKVNDLHSQDAFTSERIKDDDEILGIIYTLAEKKGIYPEEMEISIDRFDSMRIRKMEIHYTDYIKIFGKEIIPRNYSYLSRTQDRRRSL